jgi:Uma2 family endonuclease
MNGREPGTHPVGVIAPKLESVADLIDRLGGIPADRIRMQPPPGMATEQDLLRLLDAEDKRICELIDGVLVEKAVGTREGLYAAYLGRMIGNHAEEFDLGVVAGGDAPFRFRLGLVRVPDVSFVSWVRIPGDEFPDDAIAELVPDLAVEVLSKSNTWPEIELKLDDYFKAGVRLAWVIDPKKQRAKIYSSRSRMQEIGADAALVGGKVLPGFRLPLRDVFASIHRKKRKPR